MVFKIPARLLAVFVSLFCFFMASFECMAKPPAGNAPRAEAGKKADRRSKSAKKQAETRRTAFDEGMKKMSAAYMQKQYGSALAHCEKALETVPEDATETELLFLHMICMELYDKNEQYDSFLEMAGKLKAIVPEGRLDEICFSEATVLTKMHRWAEARQKYAACPGKDAKSRAVVESNVAELMMIEGDSAAAAEKYAESLSHFPDNPHAVYGLAIAMTRMRKWDDAAAMFLRGMAIDPAFSFLDEAFFEPLCENDYQKAYRLYAMKRYRDAKFYLERYVGSEERTEYRKIGQALLEKINGAREPLVAAYPVLAKDVRAVAVNTMGRKIAIAALERESVSSFRTAIWILDAENGRVTRRAVIDGEIAVDMAFADDSTLRVLGLRKRFEMNVDDAHAGYLYYDNPQGAFVFGLGNNGREIQAGTPEQQIAVLQWYNPLSAEPLGEIPAASRRARVSNDHSSALVATALEMMHLDIAGNRLDEILPAQFQITSVAVHPIKNLYALGIQSGAIIVNQTGDILGVYGSSSGAENVSFDPSGSLLAVQSGQMLELWDVSEL